MNAPVIDTSAQRQRTFGPQVPFEGDDGLYTQSWFPICQSSDVLAASVKGFPFLGGRVVVFRDEAGLPQVTSAFCTHLGADLSLGRVVDGRLQCAYHMWEFDRSGACQKTGCGDPAPRRASLYAFPTCEKHGLIWAYNGQQPHYDIPDWPSDIGPLICDTQPFPVDMPVDPWIICAQTPDIQHVKLLHKFELLGPDPAKAVEWTDTSMFYSVHARVKGSDMNIRAGIIGTSIFYQTGTLDGRWFGFITAMGLPEPGTTRLFSVFAAERSDDETEVRQFIETARNHEISIAMEDSDIAATIHFKVGSLTRQDATLARFLDYMRAFPRSSEAGAFLR